MLDIKRCTACGDCVAECPADALSLQYAERKVLLSLAYDSCISCRVCIESCTAGVFSFANIPISSVRERDQLTLRYVIPSEQIQQIGDEGIDRHRTAVAISD